MIVSKYFKFEKSLNLHEFLFVLKSKIMKRSCRIMKVLRNFGCEIIENFGIFLKILRTSFYSFQFVKVTKNNRSIIYLFSKNFRKI